MPWFFLQKAQLNDENRIFFVAKFLEAMLESVQNGSHPLPIRLFTTPQQRVTYEQFWRDKFYEVRLHNQTNLQITNIK